MHNLVSPIFTEKQRVFATIFKLAKYNQRYYRNRYCTLVETSFIISMYHHIAQLYRLNVSTQLHRG